MTEPIKLALIGAGSSYAPDLAFNCTRVHSNRNYQ